MLPSEINSLRDYPPPPRPESPIQLLQGWYYLVAGCWVAFAIGSLQSPTYPWIDLTHLWIVRGFALVMAIVGVGFIRASRWEETTPLATGAGILLPLLISLLEVAAMVHNVISTTFLIDTAMQVGFLIWWGFAMCLGGRAVSRPQPPMSGVGGHA